MKLYSIDYHKRELDAETSTTYLSSAVWHSECEGVNSLVIYIEAIVEEHGEDCIVGVAVI